MLNNITIGQYYPGDTVIHRMDPRFKIIATFLYILLLFVANNYFIYLLPIFYLAVVIFLSKVPFKIMIKTLKPILIIVFITLIINILLTPGEVLVSWKIFKITKEGLSLGFFMAMRLLLLVIGTSILTFTTSPIALTDGIEALLNPLKKIKVPAHEIAMMMSIALRFIPTLIEETDKIMKAQMARGADFESGNLIRRAKSLIPILVPLFVSAFRRADELAMAMEARAYRGGEGRTRMKRLAFSRIDGIGAVITVLLLLVVIGSRVL